MTRLALLRAAAAALACLSVAPAANADSISFIRGGDVWVASPDGARQVQLTRDGGYSYQSRADDGSFIALHGRRLHRLAPDGRLLADFDTPVSGEQVAPNTSSFKGPFTPEISPDGSRVAYAYWHSGVLNDPTCFPVGDPRCTGVRTSVGIAYTHPDRQTPWEEPGLGRQSGWVDPSWIGNDTLLMADKSVLPNVDAILDHPGDGNATIQTWFEDTGAWYVRDGEVSRRGDAAVFVSTLPRPASDPLQGQEDDQITIYRMGGAAPALPEQCFSFQDPAAILSGPSFAPDGSKVAWASRSRAGGRTDILVGTVPDQSAGCRLPTAGGATLLTDAVDPDWSPAAVPAPAGQAAPGGATAARGARPAIVRRGLARALATGLAVRVRVPSAGRLTVTVLRGARVVARGTARAKAAGRITATARFTPSARKALRGARTAPLRVRYVFTPATGAARLAGGERGGCWLAPHHHLLGYAAWSLPREDAGRRPVIPR